MARDVVRLTSKVEDLLKVSLHLAMDLISSDEHRLYIRKSDIREDDGIWKYVEGFIPMQQWRGDRSYRELFDKICAGDGEISGLGTSGGWPLCWAEFQLGSSAAGLVVLKRKPGQQEFSPTECKHLKLIGGLLTNACSEQEHLAARATELLRRLQVAFWRIDDFSKKLISSSDESTSKEPYELAKQILRQYADHSRLICLSDQFAGAQPRRPEFHPIVRTSARLLMPDTNALWTTNVDARRSEKDDCTGDQWNDERRKRQFSVSDEDSISAKVVRYYETYITNSYDEDTWPTFKLFADTKSLMVAPIISGASECLGVLALESEADARFGDQEKAAFTLLVPFYFGEFRYGSLKRPWEVRLCTESTA